MPPSGPAPDHFDDGLRRHGLRYLRQVPIPPDSLLEDLAVLAVGGHPDHCVARLAGAARDGRQDGLVVEVLLRTFGVLAPHPVGGQAVTGPGSDEGSPVIAAVAAWSGAEATGASAGPGRRVIGSGGPGRTDRLTSALLVALAQSRFTEVAHLGRSVRQDLADRSWHGRVPPTLVALLWGAMGAGDHAATGRLYRQFLRYEAWADVSDVFGADVALAHLLAVRGDRGEVADRTDRVLAYAVPRRHRLMTALAHWSRGLAALGAGCVEEAFPELARACDDGETAHQLVAAWALADYAEAAVAVGRTDDIALALDRLGCSGFPVPARTLARARALAAGADASAEDLFLDALRPTETAGPPSFQDARTHLRYGIWLRRRGRIGESRSQLMAAVEGMTGLEDTAWYRNARSELGTTSRGRTSTAPATWAARHRLTTREADIARYVAQGLTNPEIALRMSLSHRTVSGHLARIFTKAEISSRRELIREFHD